MLMLKTAARTSSRWLSRGVVAFAAAAALTGCKVIAPPAPYEEYAMARTAVRAAQDADSARFATNLWNKAEENFRSGQKAYRESDFETAKKHFQLAQQFAEKAENMTRLKKFNSGENFP